MDRVAREDVPTIDLASASPDRGVPLRPSGAQGRRRRQRRDAGVGAAVHRGGTTATRSCSKPRRHRRRSWNGSWVASRHANHGRARHGGPTPDAGGERHLPGLAAARGDRRRDARLLRPAAPRLEGRRGPRDDAGPSGQRVRLALRRDPGERARAVGDRVAIAAYLGKGDTFDRAIADFSAAYADQNERDYQTFVEAVERGKVTAERGPVIPGRLMPVRRPSASGHLPPGP